jgi:hypothetical protein
MAENAFASGFDARGDLPAEPGSVPLWSENYMFCAHDDEAGAGFYCHLGTMTSDPTLWRGTFCAYLGDRFVAAKDYGHGGTAEGPGSTALTFRCKESWKDWALSRVDVAFPTSRAELSAGLLADRAPVPVDFAVQFSASAPAWGMAAAHDAAVFHAHFEQAGSVKGQMILGGETVLLDTMGYRDHSVGPRDVSGLLAHTLVYASFPSGRVFQAFRMRGPGGVGQEAAYVVDGGVIRHLRIESLPGWQGEGDGDPGNFEIGLVGDGGAVSAKGSTRGALYYSFEAPSELLLGRDHGGGRNAAVVAPSVFIWEGEKGTGYLEMSFRPTS